MAQKFAEESGAKIVVTEDPIEAVERCRRDLHRCMDEYGTRRRK